MMLTQHRTRRDSNSGGILFPSSGRQERAAGPAPSPHARRRFSDSSGFLSHDPGVRILVVEDDKKAAQLLAKGLREESFVVDISYDGEAADEMASVNNYDMILLDWLLPRKDGLAVCRDLRMRGISTPILMLTARDALSDRVKGLNAGADDYLTKPFGFSELLARIHALLRRSDLIRQAGLRAADLTLDPASRRVSRAGVPVNLTSKEFAILAILMRRPGEVVTRSELAEGVWEEDIDTLFNALEVHVSHLRRKIDIPGAPPLIHTIRGHGYLVGLSASG